MPVSSQKYCRVKSSVTHDIAENRQLLGISDCWVIMHVIYSRDNRFQLKVGTFAWKKSSSTLLVEN